LYFGGFTKYPDFVAGTTGCSPSSDDPSVLLVTMAVFLCPFAACNEGAFAFVLIFVFFQWSPAFLLDAGGGVGGTSSSLELLMSSKSSHLRSLAVFFCEGVGDTTSFVTAFFFLSILTVFGAVSYFV